MGALDKWLARTKMESYCVRFIRAEPILKCEWGKKEGCDALQEILREIEYMFKRYCAYFYSTREGR